MTTDPREAAAGSAGPNASRLDGEVSLWEVLAVLLRRRGTLVLTTVVCVLGAVAFALLRADRFTTEASFRPQGSENSGSNLTALASQFGINIPGANASEEASPAFYADLLVSREILHRVASRPFVVDGVGSASLQDLFEIEEDTEELRLEEAIKELREDVLSIRTGRETGIVTVAVRTEWPDLSQDIAQRLLDEIARFNLHTRQSQAAAERVFIEQRVDSARAALLSAESAMQAFLQANRQWESSPDLTFQYGRLERDIQLRQQVYTTLVQSFEQARISEVRDTPVITVLQAPYFPPGPDETRLLLILALGVAIGAMAGVVLAFLVDATKRPVEGDPAREDFKETWEGLVRSIPLVGRRA